MRFLPICSATWAGLSVAHLGAGLLSILLVYLSKRVLIFAALIVWFLGLKLIADQPSDLLEWGKSAALLLLNLTLLYGVGCVFFARRNAAISDDIVVSWRNFLVAFFALHGVFLVVQFALFQGFDDLGLLNPLGAFSAPGPDPTTSDLAPYNPTLQDVKRPNGLAWEPSVAALWQLCGLALVLCHGRGLAFRRTAIMTTIAGVLVTQSVLGDIVLVAMVTHHFVSTHLRRSLAVLVYPALILGLWIALPTLADLLGLSDRIEEFGQWGSSAFLRLQAPLLLVEQQGWSWFGHEVLGARSFQSDALFLGLGSPLAGIANMYVEAFVYLGALGLLIIALLLVRLAIAVRRFPAIMVLAATFPFFGGYTFNTLGLYPFLAVLLVHGLLVSAHQVPDG